MNKNSLYAIKKLQCAYNSESNIPKVVLEADSLTIPKSEMVFILGRSGIGKSTILEALGMMNNTIVQGSEVVFTPTSDKEEKYNLGELWQKNDKQSISAIRNRYFSFIFQETNLMPNFTVYENICLTQMIQGVSYKIALENFQKAMKDVGLSNIGDHKRVYELSGGQKQRVPFVRAITPSFSVLFCYVFVYLWLLYFGAFVLFCLGWGLGN